jgi:CBS domain-containing protein
LSIFSKLAKKIHSNLSSRKIKDYMTSDVITAKKDESLRDAAHMMIASKLSCLLVQEKGVATGILTERDFIKRLNFSKDNSKLKVKDVMTKNPVSLLPKDSLVKAAKTMKEHDFRKIVVSENNILKGILTQTDLCRAASDEITHVDNPPLVKDYMTKKVFSVSSEEKVSKAVKLMASNNFGSILVIDKGVLKGVYTEFDIVSEYFLSPARLKEGYIKDLMSAPVFCITKDFDLFFINRLMLKHNFRRLAVVEEDKVIGIITQTDVMRNIYSFLEDNPDAVTGKSVFEKQAYKVVKKGNMVIYEKS